jgi:sortase A
MVGGGRHNFNMSTSRPPHWTLLAIGAFALAAALVGVAWPLLWQHRSETEGHAVLAQIQHAIEAHREAQPAGKPGGKQAGEAVCHAPEWPQELAIPTLRLVAPVEAGDGSSVLSDAVGWDPASGLPGPGQATLLVAHDVSWFSQLPALHVGDVVDLVSECGVANEFRVAMHEVTHPGARITPPAGGSVIMSTCWPTNALWFTPDRYVVVAAWVGMLRETHPTSTTQARAQAPTEVTVPPVARALTLNDYPSPMGEETVRGAPGNGWTPGLSWGLLQAAQKLWVAAHLDAGAQSAAWQQIAPTVPFPTAPLPHSGQVNVTLVFTTSGSVGATVSDTACRIATQARVAPGQPAELVVTGVSCNG